MILLFSERFVGAIDRLKNVVELESIVSKLVEGRNGNEIEALLQAGGVACHLVPIEDGGVSSIIEDTRSKLSCTPAQLRMDLPTPGRDDFEVLDKVLGYDGEKITEFVIAGVLD